MNGVTSSNSSHIPPVPVHVESIESKQIEPISFKGKLGRVALLVASIVCAVLAVAFYPVGIAIGVGVASAGVGVGVIIESVISYRRSKAEESYNGESVDSPVPPSETSLNDNSDAQGGVDSQVSPPEKSENYWNVRFLSNWAWNGFIYLFRNSDSDDEDLSSISRTDSLVSKPPVDSHLSKVPSVESNLDDCLDNNNSS